MKITIVGRGNVGGGLADLWRRAGHDVTSLGRQGGSASHSDVLVVAVPSQSIADALARVEGLEGLPTIDATNAMTGRAPGFDSLAHQVKSITGGAVAKSFNVNFASLYRQIADERHPPGNLYASDPEIQELVAGLIADCGYEPILLGGLDQARLLEDHSALAFAVYQAGMGEFFYRMAPPGQL
jgi:predicted dinucleotide-binding enzyme